MDFVRVDKTYDIVVCGGGLAGVSAAVSAARLGAKVCLVGDRPVLGGNSSSEVRVEPRGSASYHAYGRETGIISELLVADRWFNHAEVFENGWANSMWDLQLYSLAQDTSGLDLLLNTTIIDVVVEGRSVKTVIGLTLGAETKTYLSAGTFIDCTGDGVVCALAGCDYRIGSEGRQEFDELHAPDEPSQDVMGSSIQLQTRDMGRPIPFVAPDWAYSYDDASFFTKGGRNPHDVRGGWWWLEIGVPWDIIKDNETIRHQLTCHALGVWDWIKNKSPELRERFSHYAMEWLGQVPGKRESRRIMGKYLMTEQDLKPDRPPYDEVAYGGWNIDLHTPGGLLAETSEPTAAEGYRLGGEASTSAYVAPFGIPLRSLIANAFDNLFMAGRNISVTHVALGSVRVMGTTAIVGQAAGTAAGVAWRQRRVPAACPEQSIEVIQQRLLRDGVFLPDVRNEDPRDLTHKATVSVSSFQMNVGITLEESGAETGYLIPATYTDPVEYRDRLEVGRGQWLAVARGDQAVGLDKVSLLLSNLTNHEQELVLDLQAVRGIWDYDVREHDVLTSTTLAVPPGQYQWVSWDVNVKATEIDSAYLRLDAHPAPKLVWHRAHSVLPGCVAGISMTPTRYRRLEDGVTLCHRLSPAQDVWNARELTTGVARPHESTNQWRSCVGQEMPQMVELQWSNPGNISEVILGMCGHILREYDRYPPRAADPETLRDYRIQIWDSAIRKWQTVVKVEDNFSIRRRHLLPAGIETDRLRLIVDATNGANYASLYEIRCYGQDAA